MWKQIGICLPICSDSIQRNIERAVLLILQKAPPALQTSTDFQGHGQALTCEAAALTELLLHVAINKNISLCWWWECTTGYIPGKREVCIN